MVKLSRKALRWLLRPLHEPAFVRLYLAEAGIAVRGPEPARLVAQERVGDLGSWLFAFDNLETDVERPLEGRADARRVLNGLVAGGPEHEFGEFAPYLATARAWGQESSGSPCVYFFRLLVFLRSIYRKNEELRDIARYAAWEEILKPRSTPDDEPKPPAYHELHAHLRASIPFMHLWAGWLHHEPWRASLRADLIRTGGWTWNEAELVGLAAQARGRGLALGVQEPEFERDEDATPGELMTRWCDAERATVAELSTGLAGGSTPLPYPFAPWAVYLAIGTYMCTRFLYRRGGDSGAMGLEPFVRAYASYTRSQKGTPAGRDDLRAYLPAILHEFERQGTITLELRPTLEKSPNENLRRFRSIQLGYLDYLLGCVQRNGRPVVLGLVPSLFKQENPRGQRPDEILEQERVWCEQVSCLVDLLETEPWLRRLVVGLDAAGEERGCPPRALARAFGPLHDYHRRHRSSGLWPGIKVDVAQLLEVALVSVKEGGVHSDLAMDLLRDLPAGWPRLGLTCHAGEDFDDPITGLRHIDETITCLQLTRGDRIGHAIAAGLTTEDVRTMLRRRSQAPALTGVHLAEADGSRGHSGRSRYRISKPRAVHLLDLHWMMGYSTPLGRRSLQHELNEVVTRIWSGPCGPGFLSFGLNSPVPLVAAPVPGLRFEGNFPREEGARESIVIDDHHLERFEHLRLKVLHRLRVLGIAVETCPTSNVVVANLDRPPARELLIHLTNVAICTDDPAILGATPLTERQCAGLDPDAWDELQSTTHGVSFVRV